MGVYTPHLPRLVSLALKRFLEIGRQRRHLYLTDATARRLHAWTAAPHGVCAVEALLWSTWISPQARSLTSHLARGASDGILKMALSTLAALWVG